MTAGFKYSRGDAGETEARVGAQRATGWFQFAYCGRDTCLASYILTQPAVAAVGAHLT